MARPTTKKDLCEAAETQFQKLENLIDGMSEEEQKGTFLFEDRDKNLRDVLIHLYEWHNLVINFVESNMRGKEKGFFPEPYNWKTYPKLNVEFWEKHQSTPLEKAKEMLKKTHKKIMKLIETRTNDELFSKGIYKWTKGSTLGAYFVSSTSSHYNWAMKKLKKHIKMFRIEKNERIEVL